jgi:hypothetical protein
MLMAMWMVDPYNSEYDSIARYNLSDDEKYDENFPDHPLSRSRNYLKSVIDELVLSESLFGYPKFSEIEKPWWKLW